MNYPLGQLQALYELDLPPVEPDRPPPGQRGTPSAPTPGEMTWQAWLKELRAWEAANDAFENRGLRTLRTYIGAHDGKYDGNDLYRILLAARSMVAAELIVLTPAADDESVTWRDTRPRTISDGTFSCRAFPAGVIESAIGYLARALYFDGVSKGDVHFWTKMGQAATLRVPHVLGDDPGAERGADDGAYADISDRMPGPELQASRERGPAGTNRLIEASGARRILAPHIRRQVLEVL